MNNYVDNLKKNNFELMNCVIKKNNLYICILEMNNFILLIS